MCEPQKLLSEVLEPKQQRAVRAHKTPEACPSKKKNQRMFLSSFLLYGSDMHKLLYLCCSPLPLLFSFSACCILYRRLFCFPLTLSCVMKVPVELSREMTWRELMPCGLVLESMWSNRICLTDARLTRFYQ